MVSAGRESAGREQLAQTEVCQDGAHYNRSAVIIKEHVDKEIYPPLGCNQGFKTKNDRAATLRCSMDDKLGLLLLLNC